MTGNQNQNQILLNVMFVVSFLKLSKSLQSELVTMADLTEGQLLRDGMTRNRGKSQRFRLRTWTPIMQCAQPLPKKIN